MTEAVRTDANPPPPRRIVSDPDRRLHRGKDPELELPVAEQGQDVDRDLDSVCRRYARLAAGNYRERQTQAAGSVLPGVFLQLLASKWRQRRRPRPRPSLTKGFGFQVLGSCA